MRDEAEKRIADLYPKITLANGTEATVIAWLWARTVISPDPMAKSAHVPLVSSFILSTRKDRKSWAEIIRDPAAQDGWRFEVKTGKLPAELEKKLKEGTKTGRGGNFVCVLTGTPIEEKYVKKLGRAGKLRTRLMAIVAEKDRSRFYLSSFEVHEAASTILPLEVPDLDFEMPDNPRWFSPPVRFRKI
jgi:putative DNA methylase